MKMIRLLLVQKDVDQKTLDTFFSGEAELLEVQGSYQRWTNIGCSKHSERCLSHFSSWSPFSSVVVGGTTSILSNSSISSLALPWSISIISNKGHKTHNSTDASHWNSTQNTTPEFIEAIGMYSILRPHRARFLVEKHACRDVLFFSSRCWVYSFFGEDFHASCASKNMVRFLSVDDNDAKKYTP